MPRNLLAALALGCCLFVFGCGKGDDAAQNPAPAPPPPPPPVETNNGDGTAPAGTNNTPEGGGQTGTPTDGTATNGNNNGGTTGNTTPAEMVAAPNALAPHAKALSIVRPDHYAIIKFDLAGARKAKLLQDAPGDPEALAGELGFPGANEMGDMLTKVDEAWISIGPPVDLGPGAPPFQLGAYARFMNQEGLDAVLAEFSGRSLEATHSGVTYYKPESPGAGPIYHTDGLELFFSTDEATIHQAIDAKGKVVDSPLFEKLQDANLKSHLLVAGSLGPMRDTVTATLRELITESPIPLAPTTAELPAQIDWGTISINFAGETLIDIDLDMDKPENAGVMKETLMGLISIGKIMLQQQAGNVGDDPAGQQAFALTQSLINAVKVDQADAHVDLSLPYIAELDKIPEIMAAAQGSAKKASDMINAQMIGLAAHNHHAAMRKFPSNIKNEAGEEVLSWRVAILPFVEERILFDQFDRQQAWNSAANSEAAQTHLPFFDTEGTDAEAMTTWKLLPEGSGDLMFIATGKGTEVPWAQPDTFTINTADPAASLGEEPEGGYIVVYRDGHVAQLPLDEVKAALAGSEPPADTPSDPSDPLDPDPDPSPAGPLARTWTHEASGAKVEAVFVKLIGGNVTLKRSDNGKEVSLPVDALSAEDKAYLKSLRK